jgi:hypothetical protein
MNVSRAGDSVHAGDKALTRETPVKRRRVNRYAYIEKFLNLANFYGSSYYYLKTLFMYHTYRIQTKNATEMTLI